MGGIKPKELEKRLENSYEAGFFDGYHEGVDDTHIIWVDELHNVKGIGKHLHEVIMRHMQKAMKQRLQNKGLAKNELSEEVKEIGSDQSEG